MWHKTAPCQLHGTTVRPTALVIYLGWMQLWTWEKKKTTNQQQTNHHSPKSGSRDHLSTIHKEFRTEGRIPFPAPGQHSIVTESSAFCWPLAQHTDWLPAEQNIQCGMSHHVRIHPFHPGDTPASGTKREVRGWRWKQLSSASSPGQISCYRTFGQIVEGFNPQILKEASLLEILWL